MGYYMGDYYAGSRGDPGFFGSLLGKVTSLASSFIPGGSIVKAGIGAATAGIMKRCAGKVMGGIAKHPVLTAAGAAGAIGLGAGAVGERMLAGGGCPKGHHISRSRHSKRFGQCVRNRRMNPCNVHALRRASRRAHAFLRISNKLVGHFMPKRKKGRPYIKARKKK